MVGREDTSNLLLLMCYKGGALWNHTTIYLLLLVLIMMPLDWGNYNIQQSATGYGWLGYDC